MYSSHEMPRKLSDFLTLPKPAPCMPSSAKNKKDYRGAGKPVKGGYQAKHSKQAHGGHAG